MDATAAENNIKLLMQNDYIYAATYLCLVEGSHHLHATNAWIVKLVAYINLSRHAVPLVPDSVTVKVVNWELSV